MGIRSVVPSGAVILAVALASPASAGERPWRFAGELPQGGSVAFRLANPGAPVVRRLGMYEVAVRCEEGSGVIARFEVGGRTRVRDDRTFAVRSADESGGKARVSGRFSRDFQRARGVVRVFGTFFDQAGDSTGCDSGKQEFEARRAG